MGSPSHEVDQARCLETLRYPLYSYLDALTLLQLQKLGIHLDLLRVAKLLDEIPKAIQLPVLQFPSLSPFPPHIL